MTRDESSGEVPKTTPDQNDRAGADDREGVRGQSGWEGKVPGRVSFGGPGTPSPAPWCVTHPTRDPPYSATTPCTTPVRRAGVGVGGPRGPKDGHLSLWPEHRHGPGHGPVVGTPLLRWVDGRRKWRLRCVKFG